MKRIIFLPAFILLILSATQAQQVMESGPANNDLALQKSQIINDLQSLEIRAKSLHGPLAQALAQAEIADAVWALDQDQAAILLRTAYKLTLPDKDQQTNPAVKPAGSAPVPPSSEGRARATIQNRILSVARRDPKLAQELVHLGEQTQDAYETHLKYSSLALQTLQNGDTQGAASYLNQAITADPTQATAPTSILRIAERDPKLADSLILQYIERLRSFPLSSANQSAMRVFITLHNLIFRPLSPDIKAPPPGPEVMRAYVSYMLDSLSQLEQSEPGYLARYSGQLLMVWPVLQRYAPEMTAQFMSLEQLTTGGSRNTSPLPTWESFSNDKNEAKDYEARLKEALDSDQPNDLIINRAISRGDFSKARKLIDKLPDGTQKNQLTEMVNAQEALFFLKKDDLIEARRVAEKLKYASSILEVYPALIGKCVNGKDQTCASNLMLQAIKQLKSSETTPPTPPTGIPASVFTTSQESDPILEGMAKLTLAILPLSDDLALLGLDETVVAANNSQVDTGPGRAGFDVSIFKKLAPKNELHVETEAESLKDPLRQILALASIDQWKADELKKAEELKKAQELRKPQGQKTKQ